MWCCLGKRNSTKHLEKYKNTRDIIFGVNTNEQLRTEDGWVFRVDSKVLSDQSEFFKGLFSCEDINHSTLIKVVDGEMLKTILIYLDSGEINLNRQNMIDTFVWSDFFQINSLKEKCREYVLQNLTECNCLNILTIVWGKPTFGLQTECYRYVQLHFEKIIRASKAWARDLPIEVLKTFLREKSLNITGESFIWLVIQEWVNENTSERLTHVPELLTHISLAEIDEELATEIMLSPIVKENSFCVELNNYRIENESAVTNYFILLDFALKMQPELFGPRHPSRLHVITRRQESSSEIEMFLTCDGDYDMWRKVNIRKINLVHENMCQSRNRVYFWKSSTYIMSDGMHVAFHLQEEEFFLSRCSYLHSYLTVENCTYFFREPEIKIFDPLTDTFTAMKHQPHPIRTICAIELNGGIYFIGKTNDGYNEPPLMQVYWPESGTWSVPAAPNRVQVIVVKFRDRLFAFYSENENDSSNSVEEYNPLNDSWRPLPDLPFKDEAAYEVIVLKENMYVYACLGTEHVVRWDVDREVWEPISESSPLMDLHLYRFYTLEEPEALKRIVRRIRNPMWSWVKSSLV